MQRSVTRHPFLGYLVIPKISKSRKWIHWTMRMKRPFNLPSMPLKQYSYMMNRMHISNPNQSSWMPE